MCDRQSEWILYVTDRARGLRVWPLEKEKIYNEKINSAIQEATCHLRRIYLYFWRVDLLSEEFITLQSAHSYIIIQRITTFKSITTVFLLVSVCCDTAQALVLLPVSVSWHTAQALVFLLVSVCFDTAQALDFVPVSIG